MAKICRKHRIEFQGIRCPRCTAPPVVKHSDADDVPFKEEDHDLDPVAINKVLQKDTTE